MIGKPWLKFWPKGVPQFIEYPKVPLFGLLRKTVEKQPNNTAIIFSDDKMKFKELNTLSDRFATALTDMGVRKGDKVALFLPNVPQFVISYYGVLKVGAVIVPVNPLFKERELEHQLNDSEAETILVLDTLYQIVKSVRDKTRLKRIIMTSMGVPTLKVMREPGVYFFEGLMEKYPPEPARVEIDSKKDLAVLQYTGGTTGTPKGAMLTHYNLVSNAVAFAEWLHGREGEEVFMTVLPLFHIYGMTTSMNAAIYLAGTMVLVPRFDPVGVLKAVEKHRVTIFCGVPTMYAVLVSHPDVTRYDLSSVRSCISGASPLPPEVQKKFMGVTGGVLVEGYGLTESSPVTHCNPIDLTMKTVKVGSIGLPLPDTDAKIVDIETGERDLRPGEVGELVVKGPQVMKGYWKMPDETVKVLSDGWLHTGDVGRMDEDGYFYITDRKKDLIKYKGYSVYPREVEDVIYEHPAVKMCAVVGKPDPVAGEIPKAFVVLKEDATATEEEIIRFVEEKIAPYKSVREVEFRKELPITPVGKVLRRALREEERKKLE